MSSKHNFRDFYVIIKYNLWFLRVRKNNKQILCPLNFGVILNANQFPGKQVTTKFSPFYKNHIETKTIAQSSNVINYSFKPQLITNTIYILYILYRARPTPQ